MRKLTWRNGGRKQERRGERTGEGMERRREREMRIKRA